MERKPKARKKNPGKRKVLTSTEKAELAYLHGRKYHSHYNWPPMEVFMRGATAAKWSGEMNQHWQNVTHHCQGNQKSHCDYYFEMTHKQPQARNPSQAEWDRGAYIDNRQPVWNEQRRTAWPTPDNGPAPNQTSRLPLHDHRQSYAPRPTLISRENPHTSFAGSAHTAVVKTKRPSQAVYRPPFTGREDMYGAWIEHDQSTATGSEGMVGNRQNVAPVRMSHTNTFGHGGNMRMDTRIGYTECETRDNWGSCDPASGSASGWEEENWTGDRGDVGSYGQSLWRMEYGGGRDEYGTPLEQDRRNVVFSESSLAKQVGVTANRSNQGKNRVTDERFVVQNVPNDQFSKQTMKQGRFNTHNHPRDRLRGQNMPKEQVLEQNLQSKEQVSRGNMSGMPQDELSKPQTGQNKQTSAYNASSSSNSSTPEPGELQRIPSQEFDLPQNVHTGVGYVLNQMRQDAMQQPGDGSICTGSTRGIVATSNTEGEHTGQYAQKGQTMESVSAKAVNQSNGTFEIKKPITVLKRPVSVTEGKLSNEGVPRSGPMTKEGKLPGHDSSKDKVHKALPTDGNSDGKISRFSQGGSRVDSLSSIDLSQYFPTPPDQLNWADEVSLYLPPTPTDQASSESEPFKINFDLKKPKNVEASEYIPPPPIEEASVNVADLKRDVSMSNLNKEAENFEISGQKLNHNEMRFATDQYVRYSNDQNSSTSSGLTSTESREKVEIPLLNQIGEMIEDSSQSASCKSPTQYAIDATQYLPPMPPMEDSRVTFLDPSIISLQELPPGVESYGVVGIPVERANEETEKVSPCSDVNSGTELQKMGRPFVTGNEYVPVTTVRNNIERARLETEKVNVCSDLNVGNETPKTDGLFVRGNEYVPPPVHAGVRKTPDDVRSMETIRRDPCVVSGNDSGFVPHQEPADVSKTSEKLISVETSNGIEKESDRGSFQLQPSGFSGDLRSPSSAAKKKSFLYLDKNMTSSAPSENTNQNECTDSKEMLKNETPKVPSQNQVDNKSKIDMLQNASEQNRVTQAPVLIERKGNAPYTRNINSCESQLFAKSQTKSPSWTPTELMHFPEGGVNRKPFGSPSLSSIIDPTVAEESRDVSVAATVLVRTINTPKTQLLTQSTSLESGHNGETVRNNVNVREVLALTKDPWSTPNGLAEQLSMAGKFYPHCSSSVPGVYPGSLPGSYPAPQGDNSYAVWMTNTPSGYTSLLETESIGSARAQSLPVETRAAGSYPGGACRGVSGQHQGYPPSLENKSIGGQPVGGTCTQSLPIETRPVESYPGGACRGGSGQYLGYTPLLENKSIAGARAQSLPVETRARGSYPVGPFRGGLGPHLGRGDSHVNVSHRALNPNTRFQHEHTNVQGHEQMNIRFPKHSPNVRFPQEQASLPPFHDQMNLKQFPHEVPNVRFRHGNHSVNAPLENQNIRPYTQPDIRFPQETQTDRFQLANLKNFQHQNFSEAQQVEFHPKVAHNQPIPSGMFSSNQTGDSLEYANASQLPSMIQQHTTHCRPIVGGGLMHQSKSPSPGAFDTRDFARSGESHVHSVGRALLQKEAGVAAPKEKNLTATAHKSPAKGIRKVNIAGTLVSTDQALSAVENLIKSASNFRPAQSKPMSPDTAGSVKVHENGGPVKKRVSFGSIEGDPKDQAVRPAESPRESASGFKQTQSRPKSPAGGGARSKVHLMDPPSADFIPESNKQYCHIGDQNLVSSGNTEGTSKDTATSDGKRALVDLVDVPIVFKKSSPGTATSPGKKQPVTEQASDHTKTAEPAAPPVNLMSVARKTMEEAVSRKKKQRQARLVWSDPRQTPHIGQFFVNKVFLDTQKTRHWQPTHLVDKHTTVLGLGDVLPFTDLQMAVVVNSTWIKDILDTLMQFPQQVDLTVVCPKRSGDVPLYDESNPLTCTPFNICPTHTDTMRVEEGVLLAATCVPADCPHTRPLTLVHPHKSNNCNCNFYILRYSTCVRVVVFTGALNTLNWERLAQYGWYKDFPIDTAANGGETAAESTVQENSKVIHSEFYRELSQLLFKLGLPGTTLTDLWAGVQFDSLSPHVRLITSCPQSHIKSGECHFGIPKLQRILQETPHNKGATKRICQTCKLGTGNGMLQLRELLGVRDNFHKQRDPTLTVVYPSKQFISSYCDKESATLTMQDLSQLFSNGDKLSMSKKYLADPPQDELVVPHANILLSYKVFTEESPYTGNPKSHDLVQNVENQAGDKSESPAADTAKSATVTTEPKSPQETQNSTSDGANSSTETESPTIQIQPSTLEMQKKSPPNAQISTPTLQTMSGPTVAPQDTTQPQEPDGPMVGSKHNSDPINQVEDPASETQGSAFNPQESDPKPPQDCAQETRNTVQETQNSAKDMQASGPQTAGQETQRSAQDMHGSAPESQSSAGMEAGVARDGATCAAPGREKHLGFVFTGSQTVGFGSWGGFNKNMWNFARFELGVGLFPYKDDEKNEVNALDLSQLGDLCDYTGLVPHSAARVPYTPLQAWTKESLKFYRCIGLVSRNMFHSDHGRSAPWVKGVFVELFKDGDPIIDLTDFDCLSERSALYKPPQYRGSPSHRGKVKVPDIGSVVELVVTKGDRGLFSECIVHTFRDKQEAMVHYGIDPSKYRTEPVEVGSQRNNWRKKSAGPEILERKAVLDRREESYEERLNRLGLKTDSDVDDYWQKKFEDLHLLPKINKRLVPHINPQAERIDCKVISIESDIQWLQKFARDKGHGVIPQKLMGVFSPDVMQLGNDGHAARFIRGIDCKANS